MNKEGFVRFLKSQTTSAATISSRLNDVDIFFRKHRKLNTETIQRFVNDMIEQGFDSKTIVRRVSSLRKYAEFLHISLGKINVPKTHRKIPKILSKEEVVKLYQSAISIKPQDGFDMLTVRTMIILFNYLIRRQGVLDIKENDIDFENNIIYIHNKGGNVVVKPLVAGVEQIKEYIDIKRGLGINIENLLVKKYNGIWKPLQKREMYSLLYDFTQSVIGKKVNPHMFRHSIATAMLDNGADIRTLQELLDHKDIATTQFYTQISTSAKDKAYKNYHPIMR